MSKALMSGDYEAAEKGVEGDRNCLQTEFLFKDVNVNINNAHILHDVSGIVNSGEVLAVMGPSGGYYVCVCV